MTNNQFQDENLALKKKKRVLVSNTIDQSFHIRSVVKLFEELNSYEEIYPNNSYQINVKQYNQLKHNQFKLFKGNKDTIVNSLSSRYCKPHFQPVRKPIKPLQYDENAQMRRLYHYKLSKRIYCLSNKRNVAYEESQVLKSENENDKNNGVQLSQNEQVQNKQSKHNESNAQKINDKQRSQNNQAPSILSSKHQVQNTNQPNIPIQQEQQHLRNQSGNGDRSQTPYILQNSNLNDKAQLMILNSQHLNSSQTAANQDQQQTQKLYQDSGLPQAYMINKNYASVIQEQNQNVLWDDLITHKNIKNMKLNYKSNQHPIAYTSIKLKGLV